MNTLPNDCLEIRPQISSLDYTSIVSKSFHNSTAFSRRFLYPTRSQSNTNRRRCQSSVMRREGGESADVISVIRWVHTLETAACLFFRYLTCSLKPIWNGDENWSENIRDIDKGSKCGQLFSNKVTEAEIESKRHMKNDANKMLTVSWTQQARPNLRNSDLLDVPGKKIPKPALKQRPNILISW